ncbi:MAG TPA: YCF48-related protein [Candidatus Krumholzibacteria bacterium]|nr:YCF48-related protein [Candidatus Krumholzibacteria bacterium]
MRAVAVVLTALILSTAPARAGWDLVTSGVGADLHAIMEFGTTWVVGDQGTVLSSTDGLAWTPHTVPTGADLRGILMTSSNNSWFAGSDGSVIVTVDFGATWATRGVGDPSAHLTDIFSRSSGLGFVVGPQGRFFYSEDLGQTWDARPVPGGPDLLCGLCPFSGGSSMLAAGAGGFVAKTSDAGMTWTQYPTGAVEDIRDVTPSGDAYLAVGQGGLILRSTDLGETWTRIPSPTTAGLNAVLPSAQFYGHILACGDGGAMIKSTDNGLTWGVQDTPVTADLNGLESYGNHVWLAVGAGGVILRTTDGGGVTVGVEDQAPPATAVSVTELLPAAPNPFNPSTTLTFRLAQPGEVRLDLHGLDGRRVRTLVLGARAAGPHAVRWDGRDDTGRAAPSGLYLARLITGDDVRTQRLQLVR